jgi:hypothetical protein
MGFALNEDSLQPPELKLHQAGRIGTATERSRTISMPVLCASGWSNSNEPTNRSLPRFVSQAKFLFQAPPSP